MMDGCQLAGFATTSFLIFFTIFSGQAGFRQILSVELVQVL